MRLAALLGGAILLTAGCGGSSAPNRSQSHHLAAITLSSSAFAPGARIPARYTCDGADVSLPLHWTGVPAHATGLALTMLDLNASGGTFVHWQLTRIPASRTGLEPGQVPAGVTQGANGFGSTGYRGPCPPRGDPPHHYVITLTALRGHDSVALGTLTGTYGRR